MFEISAITEPREEQIYRGYAEIKATVNVQEVPPSKEKLDDYRRATSIGHLEMTEDRRREPLSLKYLPNRPIKLCEPVENLHQMGYGYTFLLYQGKFLLFMAFFPVLVYGAITMFIFNKGDDCIEGSQYLAIRQSVYSYKEIAILRENSPHSKLVQTLIQYHDSPEPNSVLRKTISLNCFLNSSRPLCKELKDMDCEKFYTKECEYKTIDLYIDNYVNQICTENLISRISFGNILSRTEEFEMVLDICDFTFVIWTFLLISGFLYFQSKKSMDEMVIHPRIEDYTVMVSGLHELHTKELPYLLKVLFKKEGFNVANVNLCFETKQYCKLLRKKSHLLNQLALDEYKHKIDEEAISHYLKSPEFGARSELVRISSINPKIYLSSFHHENPEIQKEMKEKRKQMACKDTKEKLAQVQKDLDNYDLSYATGPASDHFLGIAFVSFEKQDDRNEVLQLYRLRSVFWTNFNRIIHRTFKTSKKLILEANGSSYPLTVTLAYGPQDVRWTNFSVTKKQKTYRAMLTMIVIMLILSLNVIIIWYLKRWGNERINKFRGEQATKFNQTTIPFLLNTIQTLVIMYVNMGLRQALRQLIGFEAHHTYSERDAEKCRRIWRAQFTIKALLPCSVSFFLMDFFGNNGFIYSIMNLMISYMITTPFTFLYLQIMPTVKLINKFRVTRFIQEKAKKPARTLEQAMKYWLKPNPKMSSSHSLQIRNFAYCLFVMPIFPFATVLYIFQALEMYWVVKMSILQRSNNLIAYSSKLCRKLNDELILCLVMFILGCIVRDSVGNYLSLREFELRPVHLSMALVVFFLYITKAKNVLHIVLLRKNKTTQCCKHTYLDIIAREPSSYYLSNPAYPKEWLSLSEASRANYEFKDYYHIHKDFVSDGFSHSHHHTHPVEEVRGDLEPAPEEERLKAYSREEGERELLNPQYDQISQPLFNTDSQTHSLVQKKSPTYI